MQDDDYEKGFYLPMMDVIYSRAIVTLVNAATDSCLAPEGLPGVSSARRSHEPFKFMGTCLIESLEHTDTRGVGFLEGCTWTTRGWTFQEGLLTPRYLIFTHDQIYWQCELGSWCEASFWEREDDLRVYRHFMGDNLLSSLSTAPTDVEWVNVYLSVIRKYLSRKLSCEGDRLHALSGVLNALTRANRQPFFWAMPQGKLEQSLSFHVLPSAVPFAAKHLHATVDGEALESPFPSWSWIGWTGDSMNLRNAQSIITTGYLDLQFYSISETGSLFRVDTPQPPPESLSGVQQQIRYPTKATHPWLNRTRQVVLTSDLAPSLLANRNLLPSVLCFWSSTAVVEIGARPGLWPGGKIAVELNDGTTAFSVLWESKEDITLPLRGKLVVIGAERMRMSHGGHLTLKLMLVDRGGEGGVYRRKHLITDVWEQAWETFQRRNWELITLV
ncbi:hypothetical protein KC345_g6913 [Hortaea werneckii]|nr:hypothetical protein KC345_g6913 [Hortaea werneckii]